MNVLVVDTSVILAFYLPDEPYKAQALTLLADYTTDRIQLVTSTLSYYEALNVISRSVRGIGGGRKMGRNEALEIVMALTLLHLEEHGVHGLGHRILEVAERYQSSGYDASYLALAEHLGVDLITGDERFYNATKGDSPRVQFIANYESANHAGKH